MLHNIYSFTDIASFTGPLIGDPMIIQEQKVCHFSVHLSASLASSHHVLSFICIDVVELDRTVTSSTLLTPILCFQMQERRGEGAALDQ